MRRPNIFYGYWMIVAAFLCLLINNGTGFYGFSLFVQHLQTELGWSRGAVMTGFTIFILLYGAISPVVGRLIERYGAGKVIAVGSLVSGLGFVSLTQINSLWSFYIGWAIVGIGAAATGTVPAAAVTSNWFKKRRGMAIGIMATGVGAGGLVLAPIFGQLISSFGWRTSYLAMAIITWLLIPLALLLIKTKPADMGLYPDGAPASEAVAEVKLPTSKGLSLRMALGTSTLWLIFVGFLAIGFSHVGAVQNQTPHLQDIGFPLATAATALGGVGLGSLVGKFGFGWLCDKIKPKYACVIGCCFQLVAIVILNMVQAETSVAIIWLYAILMGLGMGSWLPTMSMLVSTNFGLASYGTIFGMAYMVLMVGSATGPLVAGHMYDTMGTYHLIFIILAALYAVSIPAILAVRLPKPKEAESLNK